MSKYIQDLTDATLNDAASFTVTQSSPRISDITSDYEIYVDISE